MNRYAVIFYDLLSKIGGMWQTGGTQNGATHAAVCTSGSLGNSPSLETPDFIVRGSKPRTEVYHTRIIVHVLGALDCVKIGSPVVFEMEEDVPSHIVGMPDKKFKPFYACMHRTCCQSGIDLGGLTIEDFRIPAICTQGFGFDLYDLALSGPISSLASGMMGPLSEPEGLRYSCDREQTLKTSPSKNHVETAIKRSQSRYLIEISYAGTTYISPYSISGMQISPETVKILRVGRIGESDIDPSVEHSLPPTEEDGDKEDIFSLPRKVEYAGRL